MPVVALVVVVVALLVGGAGVWQAICAYRTPPELRGDWWRRFERDFRAYASRTAPSLRDRRRHRGEAG